eukprot:TRINITY_DN54724_c0_g1_i1.p1 TRINITY_DN54724_c0_g1~~TRINITY_DN54724_c0_g1_i1.p1  ORF type:complete len:1020 (-),score=238.14 TRINITY_DN54724_c0_g1_i1:119-3178(-)
MVANPLEKTIPWCTVILCSLCMACHLMVFQGNLSAAGGIASVGYSTKGWSNLGLDMASTFAIEIDNAMSNMTTQLTDGIDQVVALEKALDGVLGKVGAKTDTALMQLSLLQESGDSSDTAVKKVLAEVEAEIDNGVIEVETKLDELLDLIEPAMMKVGQWYISFGDKIQAGIEQFGTTVDTVEKMMDQMMAQAGMGGENAEYMEDNTYSLFAITDAEKGIMVQDLVDVSGIYSITALQGKKAEEVHLKYDVNQDASIDKAEFSELVQDSSMPGVMALVLRSYAKRLAQVSGQVENAYLRDEVANAVVKYLQLVCAKNMTKVGWVSDTLTNGSLPIEFTAAIMKNLGQAADDPEVLTTTDIGSTVIGTMSTLNHEYTIKAQQLMSDASWWESEGFDPADQPGIVDRVSQWTAASLIQTGSWTGYLDLQRAFGGVSQEGEERPLEKLRLLQERDSMALAKRAGQSARRAAERSQRMHQQRRHAELVDRYQSLMKSTTARLLFDTLLGGEMAYHDDPTTTAAVNSGVPAKPETVQFAKWLAWNASHTAQEFQSACFNYSGMSSTPIDAFATQIQGMVKKIQSVLSMLKPYAGEQGMNKLRNKTHEFVQNAKGDILDAILSGAGDSVEKAKAAAKVGAVAGGAAVAAAKNGQDPVAAAKTAAKVATVASKAPKLPDAGAAGKAPKVPDAGAVPKLPTASLLQLAELVQQPTKPKFVTRQVPGGVPDVPGGSGVVAEMVAMLQTLQAVLPEVVDNLKIARGGVSAVSKTLDSIFETFRKQGLPIFQQLASVYTYIWLAWFLLLSTFTLGILYYGFWASGWFGGPTAPETQEAAPDEEYVPPSGFGERMRCLCRACCSALCCECCPKTCLFWSLLLLGQVFVLIIFVMAIVLTMIAGIEMFMSSGCSGIYLLGDEKSCTETMKMMQDFLTTFTAGGPDLPIEEVCVKRDLMTCSLLATKMQSAAILCTVGAFLAGVFSFQLLIESAILFERAQSRRLVDALLKGDAKVAEDVGSGGGGGAPSGAP